MVLQAGIGTWEVYRQLYEIQGWRCDAISFLTFHMTNAEGNARRKKNSVHRFCVQEKEIASKLFPNGNFYLLSSIRCIRNLLHPQSPPRAHLPFRKFPIERHSSSVLLGSFQRTSLVPPGTLPAPESQSVARCFARL